jgi:ADP-heptose:LPS heptosyltransferase
MLAFSKVHTLKNAKGGWKMGFDVLKILPKLLSERFDAVLDLQNNIHSRTVRRALFPAAWCQFDRFSKIHAARRYQNTVNAIELGCTEIGEQIALRDEWAGIEKLKENGWNGRDQLIVLNPCGLYPTRQWGTAKYLEFARMWLQQVDQSARFLLLGYSSMQEKVALIEKELGPNCLNLLGKTSAAEACNILRQVHLTLSDDGGLLHLSWINHVPTIGFLGASPSYWGIPLGDKSFGFTSADLPCGDCHRTDCLWGDNRCLARVTPVMAFEKAKALGAIRHGLDTDYRG